MDKIYEDALAKLVDEEGNPTPQYQAYLRYEQIWNSKVAGQKAAYSLALEDPMKLQKWPLEGSLLHNEIDQAFNQWIALGYKYQIEQALATLAAQGIDPLTIKKRNQK